MPPNPDSPPPRLAILFWCYKEPELCADRLRHLRRRNAGVPLYLLYGGAPEQAESFQRALAPLADDFYAFDEPPPPGIQRAAEAFRHGAYWKYRYGDWLIARWFACRGVQLDWDTLLVIQWDMLVYGDVRRLFGMLRQGEILLSGLRPLAEVENDWAWTTPSHAANRLDFEAFMSHIRETYGYDATPHAYLAVVTALPRDFLARFSQIARPELGFLEYRLPAYAQVFGAPFCTDHPYQPWWGAVERFDERHTLRARPVAISLCTILRNLLHPRGARLFHPYFGATPDGLAGWARASLGALRQRGGAGAPPPGEAA
jgi:hypothetical protein